MAYPNAKVIRALINSCLSNARFGQFAENGVNVQDLQVIVEALACEIGDADGLADLNAILVDDNLVAAINSILTRLASTADGYGADLVGVEDALEYFAGDTVEEVLAELHEAIVASNSLQEAYVEGNAITTSAAEGHVDIGGDQMLVLSGSVDFQAQNDADVYGSVTIGVDLAVDGVSNLDNTDIDGTLDVLGVVDMHASLDMNNTDIDNIKDLDVDGIVDVKGAADFASTVAVHGDLSVITGADLVVADDEDNVSIGGVLLGSHDDPSGADIVGVEDGSLDYYGGSNYFSPDTLASSSDVQDALEYLQGNLVDIDVQMKDSEDQLAALETFTGQSSDTDDSPTYLTNNYIDNGDDLEEAIGKLDGAISAFSGDVDLQTVYDNTALDVYSTASIIVDTDKDLVFRDDDGYGLLELIADPAGSEGTINIGDVARDDTVNIRGTVNISDVVTMWDDVIITDNPGDPFSGNYISINPASGDISITGSLYVSGDVTQVDTEFTDFDHQLIRPTAGAFGLGMVPLSAGFAGLLFAADVYGTAYGTGSQVKILANGDFYIDDKGPLTGAMLDVLTANTTSASIDDADGQHFHKASKITAIDEFDHSDAVNVQDVLDDLDAAITDIVNNISWDNVYDSDSDSILDIDAKELYFDLDGYGFNFRDSVNAAVASFNEAVIDFSQPLDMNGESISSVDDIDINGDADIEGNVTIELILDVEGAVDFNGTLDVHDDIHGYSDLDIDGYGVFGDDVTLESGANLDLVAGNITLANSYTVDGRDVSVDGSLLDDHIADDAAAKHDADQIDFEYADGSKLVIQAASDTVEEAIRDLDRSVGDKAGNASLNLYDSNNYVVDGYGVLDAISRLDAALSASDNQVMYHMQVSDSSGGAIVDFGDGVDTKYFVVTAGNAEEYKSGTLKIFVDGILQIPTSDYVEDGDNDGFTFVVAPTATQQIRVEFEKNN